MGDLIRLPATIDTTRYIDRWGSSPQGRDEVWAVADRNRPGGVFWYRGPYTALARRLPRNGAWYLIPVPQGGTWPDDIPRL